MSTIDRILDKLSDLSLAACACGFLGLIWVALLRGAGWHSPWRWLAGLGASLLAFGFIALFRGGSERVCNGPEQSGGRITWREGE